MAADLMYRRVRVTLLDPEGVVVQEALFAPGQQEELALMVGGFAYVQGLDPEGDEPLAGSVTFEPVEVPVGGLP